MTIAQFMKLRKMFNDECESTLLKKGRAYTRGGVDKFANFKRCASDLGVTAQLAWAIYFHKHMDAIYHYIVNGEEGPEGIRENIKDARNYLDLLMGLCAEQKFERRGKDDVR